ncbi:MAG: TolC family protein [Bacteroidia bacterium]
MNKQSLKHTNTFQAYALMLVLLLCNVVLIAQDSTKVQARQKPQVPATKLETKMPTGIQIDTITFDPDVDLASQIPSLDSLITIALKNNPNLKFEDASIRKADYNLKYTRYLWLNGMTGFFNYTYGNQTNLNTVNADGSVLNNSLGVGWRAGFNFTLPFTELTSRNYRMKQMRAELDMAKAKRQDQEMDLRRLIIQDYFNLLAAQKLLWIRTQDVESAKLTSEIATVEMKRGKIHPQELSRLKNLQALAESNLELTKKDFMTYYYFLENWIGVKLTSLRIK